VAVTVTGVQGRETTGVAAPPSAGTGRPPEGADSARGRPATAQANPVVVPSREGEGTSARGSTSARVVELAMLVALIGAMAFRFLVLSRLGDVVSVPDAAEGARRLGMSAAAILLVAELARLTAEVRAVNGPSAPLATATIRPILLDSAWGHGWLVAVAGVVVAAVGLALGRRGSAPGWSIAGVGTLVAALGPALTGHAIAGAVPGLAVVVDWLHVLGGGCWLGALLYVTGVGIGAARRTPTAGASARALVDAFSPVALASAGAVVASGAISAWLRLGSVAALTTSPYGQMLLRKLVVFAIVAALGAYNWKRSTPGLATEGGVARLRRAAALELAGGLVIVVLTAFLVTMPLPHE
jgi:putative copper export protein